MKHYTNTLRTSDLERARTLVGKFLDGATSDVEEAWISAFYRSAVPGTLPADLESARTMFLWFDSLPAAAAVPRRRRSPRRSIWLAAAGVAAAVMLAFSLSFFLVERSAGVQDQNIGGQYGIYSGSYIIRNGERVDDLPVIYDEIVATEHLADSLSGADLADTLIDRTIERIGDPELANYVRKEIFEQQ